MLAAERGPAACRPIAAAYGNTLVSALGILFNTGAGQHILKNPLVVNSIIDKVGAAARAGAGGTGRESAAPAWLRPSRAAGDTLPNRAGASCRLFECRGL